MMDRKATIHNGDRLSKITFWTGHAIPQIITTINKRNKPDVWPWDDGFKL